MPNEPARSWPSLPLGQPPEIFLSIREARLEDLPQVASLLTDSFHSQGWFVWLAPVLRLGIYQDLRSRHLHPPRHHACLLGMQKTTASSQERPVGTVEVSVRSLSLLSTELWRYPYISNLAVDPKHRRQGVAQRLLLACERTVESWGMQDLYLHVLENNAAAYNLYTKAGYRVKEADSYWSSHLWGRPRRLMLHKRLNDQNF